MISSLRKFGILPTAIFTTIFLFFSQLIWSQCPRVDAILVDACGVEQNNEFIVIHSGGSGFNTSDIIIDFAMGNNAMSAFNNDINTDVNNFPPGTPCGLTTGNISAYTGCSNLIAIGPGFNVPPNQIVILQGSSMSTNALYDFSSLCGSNQCVYVIANSCSRTIGAFTNAGSGTRTTVFEFGGGCMQTVIYDLGLLTGTLGDYYVPQSNTYGNGGCTVPPSSPAQNATVPTFTINNMYCVGDSPDPLSTTSDNGIPGTWLPATINTSSPGSTNYVFTPNTGQCATPFTLMVTVTANITPSFSFNTVYCQNEVPASLPSISDNGVSGTWNPATINTSTPGMTSYMFTPDMGQCAPIVSISVTVNPLINPIFNIDVDYCVGDTPDILPGTSNNGINGTWNPGVINTSSPGMVMYTFTPNAGQCASTFMLSVTVSNTVTPTFSPIGDLCEGSIPPTLSNMSLNGISGTWSPAFINTSVVGTFMYTFTPNNGQCAMPLSINVTVLPIPMAFLSGALNLCPGQCGEVSFNLTGGSGLYTLNMQISLGAFSIPFTIPGATVSTTLNICYTGSGFIPQFQAPATLILPISAPSGSATLTLLSIADGNGGPCPNGQIGNNTMSLTLLTRPPVFNASLTVCDEDNDGLGIFDLTTIENVVTGNNNNTTVLWYSNSILTNQINNPSTYVASDGTVVYALVIDNNGCENGAEVTLILQIPMTPMAPTFSICVTDPPLNLPTTISGITGNWSDLNGYVSSNQFNPSGVPEGNYTLTFTPNFGQCYLPVNTTIMVTSGGPIPLGGIPLFVCIGAGTLTLPTMPNGVNGIWSSPSPHLSGNIFNVTNAGVGMYELTYTPDDPSSCFLPNTIQIEVVANSMLTPPVFNNICENSGLFSLGNTVNGVTGDWGNSPHVITNMFNTNVGAGTYPITFTPSDNCTNPLDIMLVISTSMNLTPPVFSNLCSTSPPIVLPTTVQSINGTWTLNSVVLTSFDPMVHGNGNYTLVFMPTAGQCANSLNSTITVGSVFAGDDTNFSICLPQNPIFDLDSLLSTNAQAGGSWLYNGLPVATPSMYNLSGLMNGSHVFLYILMDNTCGNDTSNNTIVLERTYLAGNDGNLMACQTDVMSVNIASILSTYSSGGTWTNNRNLNINYANLNAVDLSNLPVGNTLLTYRFDAGICLGDTAHISVTIDSFYFAGLDKIGDVCLGSIVDLNKFVDSSNQGGTFEDINGHGGLTGSMWDSGGKPLADFTFSYFFASNGACPADSAIITLSVKSIISAGDDVLGEYCDGQGFVPSDFFAANASLGGKLYNFGFEISMTNPVLGNIQQYQFLYITGDGITCPFDTAIWMINKVNKPNISFIINDVTLCEGECSDLVLRHNSTIAREITFSTVGVAPNFTEVFTIVPGQDLVITICSDPTQPASFYNVQTALIRPYHLVSFKHQFCDFIFTPPIASIISVKGSPQIDINETLCLGTTRKIGSTIFDENNPTGTVLVPGIGNQCDTIYTVSLSFYPPTNGIFSTTVCDPNYSITIGGTVFNQSNTSGSVVLPNASKNGCDSTVFVNIIFNQVVENELSPFTCDPTFSLIIGSTVFNQSNPSGQVILNNAAVNGCDSIVKVNITFGSNKMSFINNSTCDPTYSIVVGSTTFNLANPVGSVTLSGAAANGCDSIVNINLTFNTLLVGEKIDLPICGENEGSITFTSANGALPFTLKVNGTTSNTITSFPFEKPLPSGSYVIDLISDDGCFLTYNVVIPDNSTPFITLDSSLLNLNVYQLSLLGDVNRLYDIQWSPSNIMSCDTCKNTVATIFENTNVDVTYFYGNDCIETIQIRLIKTDEAVFEIPNAFKPSSGTNGIFYIVSPPNFNGSILRMAIYDRWGNKVFFKENVALNDPSLGWDGSFSGRDVIPGVYVYSVEILNQTSGIITTFQGDLTLIR
ncbi:MAG: gliding motility-associated C-terminal domain-containing protein [Saprospiraceae bacterium]